MNKIWSVILPFQRTLLFQAMGVVIIAQTALVLIVLVLLQTSLVFRLVPGVVDEHAVAINELIFLLESTPEEATPMILSTFSGTARSAVVLPGHIADQAPPTVIYEAFQAAGEVTGYPLSEREFRYRSLTAAQIWTGRQAGDMPRVLGIGGLELSIDLRNGDALVIWMTPAAFIARPSTGFIAILWVSIVLMAAIFLHIIFAPLRSLERASRHMGQTSKPIPVKETGPEDIRRVARALNDVQGRVQDLLAKRSKMMAAVAHDIRTGLTRLRLRFDASETELPPSVADDLAHIETLVTDMMAYARAEEPSVSSELVELRGFLADMVESLPFQMPFSCDGQDFWVAADKASLKRAFTNLIENARLYGEDVSLRCETSQDGLAIFVEDRGPGIPEDKLASVFDPFVRLETSRNRETGGTGLGLTISRSLLSAQGAVLSLHNRDGGGLSARIFFSSQDEVR